MIWNSAFRISAIWKKKKTHKSTHTIIDFLKILVPYNFGWGLISWLKIFYILYIHLNWIKIINLFSSIRNSKSKTQIALQKLFVLRADCASLVPPCKKAYTTWWIYWILFVQIWKNFTKTVLKYSSLTCNVVNSNHYISSSKISCYTG